MFFCFSEEKAQQTNYWTLRTVNLFLCRGLRRNFMSYGMMISDLLARVPILNRFVQNRARHLYGHVYYINYLGKDTKCIFIIPIYLSRKFDKCNLNSGNHLGYVLAWYPLAKIFRIGLLEGIKLPK